MGSAYERDHPGGFCSSIPDPKGRSVRFLRPIVYPGAPHGLPTTHEDKLNADLPAFHGVKHSWLDHGTECDSRHADYSKKESL
jgi:hypothetical protein